jgi:predicted SnoaL-like aldol condensation-catalyzing enzyme
MSEIRAFAQVITVVAVNAIGLATCAVICSLFQFRVEAHGSDMIVAVEHIKLIDDGFECLLVAAGVGLASQPLPKEDEVMQTVEEKNKAFVLEAFETLFNERDYVAAERFWSPNYIQHSAHIPPGREGLFNMIKGLPDDFRYENGLVVANGDYVLLHGRFSGIGLPANWIVADIVRLENGKLAEHWDVIQDQVKKEASRSGLPMSSAFRCRLNQSMQHRR